MRWNKVTQKLYTGREVGYQCACALRSEADKLNGGGFDSQRSYFLNWIILVEGSTFWLTKSFGAHVATYFPRSNVLTRVRDGGRSARESVALQGCLSD